MEYASPNPVRAAIRAQFRYALLLSGLGIGFLAIFIGIGADRLSGPLHWMPPASGIFLLYQARKEYRNAVTRKHGLAVERTAVDQARPLLNRYGFAVSANVVTRAGDVDLLVGYATQQVPVEIKSFETWDDKPRCQLALAQVNRLRGMLRAKRAYIWLPNARVGFFARWMGTREGATTVVYGNARQLARIIRRQEG